MHSKERSLKRVLITGADGKVGQLLRPYLKGKYALRIHTRHQLPSESGQDEEHVVGELASLPDMEAIMEDVDAVVHLAAVTPSRSSWEEVRIPNIDGVYNVFEAARRKGVPRVIFASTNHVTGMYDRHREWPIDPGQPVRPDGYYGVSKAFGEALGRYYSDEFGMHVICLRIGWVLKAPFNEQGLRMWISPRDFAQLVQLSLETDIRFGIYYGVSNNTRNKWNIENARRELGYEPIDNSEIYAEAILEASSNNIQQQIK